MYEVRVEITEVGRVGKAAEVRVQDTTITAGPGALEDVVQKLGKRAIRMMEEGEKK